MEKCGCGAAKWGAEGAAKWGAAGAEKWGAAAGAAGAPPPFLICALAATGNNKIAVDARTALDIRNIGHSPSFLAIRRKILTHGTPCRFRERNVRRASRSPHPPCSISRCLPQLARPISIASMRGSRLRLFDFLAASLTLHISANFDQIGAFSVASNRLGGEARAVLPADGVRSTAI